MPPRNLYDLTKSEAHALLEQGQYVVWTTSDGRYTAKSRTSQVELIAKVLHTLRVNGPATEATLYNRVGRHNQVDEKEFGDLLRSISRLSLVGNKWVLA